MLHNKEQLFEILTEYIKEKKVSKIREIFEEYNIVDLAEIFSQLSIEEEIFIFRILQKDISAELFSYLSYDKQEELINIFGSSEVNNILDNMFNDDIIDFLEEMPANVIKKILLSIPNEKRSEINALLSYGEFSAGSIMSSDFIELNSQQDVESAIKKIKKQARLVETVNVCFVVDQYRNYLGVVHLRDIIVAKNNTLIKELVEETNLFVYTDTDQEEVAKILSEYDITSIAVLNNQKRLIGIITADDVIDVLVEEATEDIHKMGGISGLDGSYVKTSIKDMVKSRVTWLLILMISASFTGYILQVFEDKLSAVASLAISIPVIMSTAGNAGSQSSATIIRGIATEDLNFKNHFLTIIGKELLVGLLCGSIVLIVNFIRLIFIGGDIDYTIALIVSATLFISIITANIVGGILPLLAKVFKIDPASMAAPIITTIVDATSLIVYFYLAIYFLNI